MLQLLHALRKLNLETSGATGDINKLHHLPLTHLALRGTDVGGDVDNVCRDCDVDE